MGRKSLLSETQWADIDQRLILGEEVRPLAREYGISEACIRARIRRLGNKPTVQKVAAMIVQTDAAMSQLPVSGQCAARTLAAKLISISESVASAAELGAMTGHRLHALANSEVAKVDDANIASEDSISALKGVGVLTKLANESLVPALNLLSANRDRMNKVADEQPVDEPLTPERLTEGARRIAFMLHRAAVQPENAQ